MSDATYSKEFKGGTLSVTFHSPWSCRVTGDGFLVNRIPHGVSESFGRGAFSSYDEGANAYRVDQEFKYTGSYTRRTDVGTFGVETTRNASSAIHDAARELVREAWALDSIRKAANDAFVASEVDRCTTYIERMQKRIDNATRIRTSLESLNDKPVCGLYTGRHRSGDSHCALPQGHKGDHLEIHHEERY